MVRKAIVKDLCDMCLNDTSGDAETDADFCMVIKLNGGTSSLEIDLCTDHAGAMTVIEMIAETRDSAIEKVAKSARFKEPCQFCGKPYSHGSGMALHIKSAHQEQINAHKVMVTG